MASSREMLETPLDRSGESRRQKRHPLGRVADRGHAFCEGLSLYFYNHLVSRIPSHAVRLFFYRRIFEIGEGSSILMGVTIWRPSRLTMGSHSTINSGCVIDSRGTIKIGDSVNLAGYVQIWTADHDPDDPWHNARSAPVEIGNHVWVATRATILPGVKIGEGAVVAAASLVNKDVPPYWIVGGVPARKIQERARDLKYRISWRPPFR
jgi:acetyltransferase-like isoleucine patch superfamily enzyme